MTSVGAGLKEKKEKRSLLKDPLQLGMGLGERLGHLWVM